MFRPIALASVMGVALVTSASAMSFAPTIPTPANPHPLNPVATNGSPLPSKWFYDGATRPDGAFMATDSEINPDAYRPVY